MLNQAKMIFGDIIKIYDFLEQQVYVQPSVNLIQFNQNESHIIELNFREIIQLNNISFK